MFDPKIQNVMDKVDQLRHEVDDHWQIPKDEALLLAQLVRLGNCKSICEIGTSYGYSSLHFAAAAKQNSGQLHCFDISKKKIDAATKHLTEADLIDSVTLHLGDARQTVSDFTPENPYDFVFIDATKEQSFEYLKALQGKLADKVTIATDNTSTHGEQLAPFVEHLRSLDNVQSCQVSVGNGFELTIISC